MGHIPFLIGSSYATLFHVIWRFIILFEQPDRLLYSTSCFERRDHGYLVGMLPKLHLSVNAGFTHVYRHFHQQNDKHQNIHPILPQGKIPIDPPFTKVYPGLSENTVPKKHDSSSLFDPLRVPCWGMRFTFSGKNKTTSGLTVLRSAPVKPFWMVVTWGWIPTRCAATNPGSSCLMWSMRVLPCTRISVVCPLSSDTATWNIARARQMVSRTWLDHDTTRHTSIYIYIYIVHVYKYLKKIIV